MSDEAQGGRIFFSSTGRSLVDEDEIVVLSVGVDIGSSTSHLVFSRIVLERLDSRYVVTTRETFHESDILLTPYSAGETIDADALGAFIEQQYTDAKIDPDEIDTGALILTGVAVRRSNARAIGELFARQAGKMVAVSAGDSLETVMAAYGSGAVARSIRDNVDRDECRHRRRHLQDRGLRRRQGRRPHRGRRRRAARLPRRRRQDRAHRGSRPALRRRARHHARAWRDAVVRALRRRSRPGWRTGCSRRCRAARRSIGGSELCRLDPLILSRQDRPRSRSPAACPNTSTAARRTLRRPRHAARARRSARASRAGDRRIEPSNEGIRATVDRRLAIHHAGLAAAPSTSRRWRRCRCATFR